MTLVSCSCRCGAGGLLEKFTRAQRVRRISEIPGAFVHAMIALDRPYRRVVHWGGFEFDLKLRRRHSYGRREMLSKRYSGP